MVDRLIINTADPVGQESSRLLKWLLVCLSEQASSSSHTRCDWWHRVGFEWVFCCCNLKQLKWLKKAWSMPLNSNGTFSHFITIFQYPLNLPAPGACEVAHQTSETHCYSTVRRQTCDKTWMRRVSR